MPKTNLSREELFWKKVAVGPECWVWIGTTNKAGYGSFKIEGGTTPAHRYMHELVLGPIPEGYQIDHGCRNHWCVNPAHLESVTFYENVRRGRAWVWGTELTHCKQNHEFTPENTGRTAGKRWCRTCKRSRTMKWYYSKKRED